MGLIQLIIYLLIAIVSLCSLIGFIRQTRQMRKASEAVKNSLEPSRSLTAEEADAVQSFYGVPVEEGQQVFRIEGGYCANSLSGGGTNTTHHWLGNIEVDFKSAWVPLLTENNCGDVVFSKAEKEDKGCAFLLNLNKKMDIRELVVLQQKLENGASGEIEEAGICILGQRPLSVEEAQSRTSEGRFFSSLLICIALALLFLANHSFWLAVASGPMVLIGSWIFVRKRPLIPVEVTRIQGPLSVEATVLENDGHQEVRSSLNIGKVKVTLPGHWDPEAEIGSDYQADVILSQHDGAANGEVLSLGERFSLEDEVRKFGWFTMRRHVTACILLGIALIFFWVFVEDFGGKLEMLGNSLLNSTENTEFIDYESILATPPEPGREIRLSAMTITPTFVVIPDVSWVGGSRTETPRFEIREWRIGRELPPAKAEFADEIAMAQTILLLRSTLKKHLRGLRRGALDFQLSRYFGPPFLVGKESLARELRGSCETLPNSLGCGKLVDYFAALEQSPDQADQGELFGKMRQAIYASEGEKGQERSFSLTSRQMADIGRHFEQMLRAVERLAEQKIIGAFMVRSEMLGEGQAVFLQGIGARLRVPALDLGNIEKLSSESVTAAVEKFREGLEVARQGLPIETQGIVAKAGIRGESLHLVLDDRYSYERPGEYVFEPLAILGASGLFLFHLIRSVILYRKQQQRAQHIDVYYRSFEGSDYKMVQSE